LDRRADPLCEAEHVSVTSRYNGPAEKAQERHVDHQRTAVAGRRSQSALMTLHWSFRGGEDRPHCDGYRTQRGPRQMLGRRAADRFRAGSDTDPGRTREDK
jgi:hypothetical protein